MDEEIIIPSYEHLELSPIKLAFKDVEDEFIIVSGDREVYLIDIEGAEGYIFSVKKDEYANDGLTIYKYDKEAFSWFEVQGAYDTKDKIFSPDVHTSNVTIRKPNGGVFAFYSLQTGVYKEDMNNLSFDPHDWIKTEYEGSLCLRNKVIPHSSSSKFTITTVATKIKLRYKIESEKNCDFFTLTVNGSEVLRVSGTLNWQEFEYAMSSEKENIITFKYHKDGSVNTGMDCVLISDIEWFNIVGNLPDLDAGSRRKYVTSYCDSHRNGFLLTADTPIYTIDNGEYCAWSTSDSVISTDYEMYKYLGDAWLKENYYKELRVDFGVEGRYFDIKANYNIILPNKNFFFKVGNSDEFIPSIQNNLKKRYFLAYEDLDGETYFLTGASKFYIAPQENEEWHFVDGNGIQEGDRHLVYKWEGGSWKSVNQPLKLKSRLFLPHNALGNIDILLPSAIDFYTPNSLIPNTIGKKYLIVDGSKVYASNGEEYEFVANTPIKQEHFVYYGTDNIPTHPSTVLSSNAKLMYYTELQNQSNSKSLFLNVVPKLQRIVRSESFDPQGCPIRGVKIYSTEQEGGKARFLLSVDGGKSYIANRTGEWGVGYWEQVDIDNEQELLEKSMTREYFQTLHSETWGELQPTSINIMTILDKEKITDTCEVSAIHVYYQIGAQTKTIKIL